MAWDCQGMRKGAHSAGRPLPHYMPPKLDPWPVREARRKAAEERAAAADAATDRYAFEWDGPTDRFDALADAFFATDDLTSAEVARSASRNRIGSVLASVPFSVMIVLLDRANGAGVLVASVVGVASGLCLCIALLLLLDE